eukprot:SAG11_NODE_10763_length_807_cov_1.063559_1_plen_46_part_10
MSDIIVVTRRDFGKNRVGESKILKIRDKSGRSEIELYPCLRQPDMS